MTLDDNEAVYAELFVLVYYEDSSSRDVLQPLIQDRLSFLLDHQLVCRWVVSASYRFTSGSASMAGAASVASASIGGSAALGVDMMAILA